MKALKRVFKNIKWAIFNHPVHFTNVGLRKCDYCERMMGCFDIKPYFTICWECMGKAFGKVLKNETKKSKSRPQTLIRQKKK